MACRTSGNGTCVDPFCFVTAINQKTAAANFGCGNVTRPLNKIKVGIKNSKYLIKNKFLKNFQVRQEFYFKLFEQYIPFNIFPEVEFCSFIKKPDKNSFFYSIVNVMNEKVPGFIHQCPYQGKDFQVRNLKLTVNDLALWINGEYKIVFTFYDDIDKRILQVSAKGVIGKRQ